MKVRVSKIALPIICLLPVFAVLLVPVFGGFRPSFGLEYPSWNATHIALVEITPHDGDFIVLESWKGDLKAGEHINVPQLIPGPHAVPITPLDKDLLALPIETIPKQPPGSRMVLFLMRPVQSTSNATISKTAEWQPADIFHDMSTSVIWLYGSQLFVFRQWNNPGPSLLSRWDSSLESVHERVVEIIATKKSLYAVLRLEDKAKRAEQLKPYVHSDVLPAKRLALEQLGKCGPSAMEIIRPMLDDPVYKLDADDLINAYAEAGGDSAGEELNNRLQKELAFWEKTGPTLQQGWWGQDVKPDAPLRLRYSQTIQLIRCLHRTHYKPALKTAVELRDFWRSQPQLELDQLARECASLVNHLQKIN